MKCYITPEQLSDLSYLLQQDEQTTQEWLDKNYMTYSELKADSVDVSFRDLQYSCVIDKKVSNWLTLKPYAKTNNEI